MYFSADPEEKKPLWKSAYDQSSPVTQAKLPKKKTDYLLEKDKDGVHLF